MIYLEKSFEDKYGNPIQLKLSEISIIYDVGLNEIAK